MTDTSGPVRQETPTQGVESPQAPAPADARTDGRQWYVSSGPPQALRWLAEEFAYGFAAVAGAMLRADLRVRLTAAAESTRAEFCHSLEDRTCSFLLTPEGTDACQSPRAMCLEFSPSIANVMVECLLGGMPSAAPAEARPLTATERRVLHRLAEATAVGLSAAWPEPDKPRLHADRRPVPPAAAWAEEPVVVLTFELSLGGHVGTMRLCAARQAVGSALPPAAGRRTAAGMLELTAALEGIAVDEADLAELAAGDIIATDVAADGEVIVRIGGIPKYAARLGASGDRKSLTITRRLDAADPPPAAAPSP